MSYLSRCSCLTYILFAIAAQIMPPIITSTQYMVNMHLLHLVYSSGKLRDAAVALDVQRVFLFTVRELLRIAEFKVRRKNSAIYSHPPKFKYPKNGSRRCTAPLPDDSAILLLRPPCALPSVIQA